MTWSNYDDVVGQITAAGIMLGDEGLRVGTSKSVRCRVDGDRERRGWYWLHEFAKSDGTRLIVGSFGVFRGDDANTQKVQLPKSDRQAMTSDQLEAMRARLALDRKRADADRAREAASAADRAARWWRQAQEVGQCAYLARKGFPADRLFGARVSPSGNLVVPMYDGDGKIHGLQVIYGDPTVKVKKGRDKEYTPKGLAKKGHWFMIGSPVADGVVLLCEGFATGASLHAATGLPVAVAFDANGLVPVAKALRQRYRRVRVMVCADDDYLGKCRECHTLTAVSDPVCAHCGKPHGRHNTGATSAEAAAMAVSGAWLRPIFPGERPVDRKGPTDFNDLHTHPGGGLRSVAAQVEQAIASAGWRSPPLPPAAGLATEGGGDGGSRRPAVSTMPLEQIVERFISVDDDTGDFAFDTWTHNVVRRSKIASLLPARVRWDDVKDHPVWRSRAVYIDQIGFDPGGEDENIVCNRWSGWPTAPAAGSCESLLELLRYLCGNEPTGQEVYHWLLRWLAYPLQYPGAKMHSAVVVHGPQGTGKSRFFEAYAKIFGDYAMVLNQGAIEDKFNSDWCERKLFILADEIVARQDMFHLKNQLKNFITGEWVRVNPKNVAAHRERNHMNIVFLSNEKQPVVLENDDRRHLVIWTPQKLSEAYYDEVAEEISEGGVEALHHYLLTLDLGDFRPWTRPPMTHAKQALIDINRESVDRFVIDWASGDIEGLPYGPCGSSDLYAAYAQWCRREGVKNPRESNQFAGHLDKINGWRRGHKDRFADTHYSAPISRQRMVIPHEESIPADFRADALSGYAKGVRKPDGKSQTEWLTDCFFGFRTALQGATP